MSKEVSDQMSQRIERDIRQLIGDQAVQIIVLRAAMEAAQRPQEQPQPQKPPPPVIPPQPEQPDPERKEPAEGQDREQLHVRRQQNGSAHY